MAVWKNGRVQRVVDENGNAATPSIVAFVDDDAPPLVGHAAAAAVAMTPTIDAVFAFRRLLLFPSPHAQRAAASLPYTVVPDAAAGHGAAVALAASRSGRDVSIVNVAAALLAQCKATAEAFLGNNAVVRGVAVSMPTPLFVPTYRAALRNACEKAGLRVRRWTTDARGAAPAYDLLHREAAAAAVAAAAAAKEGATLQDVEVVYVICEIDATSFQVEVLNVGEGMFVTLATSASEDYDDFGALDESFDVDGTLGGDARAPRTAVAHTAHALRNAGVPTEKVAGWVLRVRDGGGGGGGAASSQVASADRAAALTEYFGGRAPLTLSSSRRVAATAGGGGDDGGGGGGDVAALDDNDVVAFGAGLLGAYASGRLHYFRARDEVVAVAGDSGSDGGGGNAGAHDGL
jgi:hypothetical protein